MARTTVKMSESQILEERRELDILHAQLDNEQATFEPYYKELSNYILPRRSRFFVSDVNQGDRRNRDIIDNTAGLAARTLSSGLMTGVTSPARPWFKLGSRNPLLAEDTEVKRWLEDVEAEMRSSFIKSNLYNALPILYSDVGTFATGCMFQEEDEEMVFNFQTFLAGQYRIGLDRKGRVRVFLREFQMSVRQVVEKFGMVDGNYNDIDWTNISDAVRGQWEGSQNYESRVDIVHIIRPNPFYKPGDPRAEFKQFRSIYYEKGLSKANPTGLLASSTKTKFLKVSGYSYFPVMAPRWEVAGEDTYGTNSPGMMSLGDVKQLQLGEKRAAQAIDQKVNPALVAPTTMRNAKVSILPGDITFLDERDGTQGLRRAYEVDFQVNELEGKQEQVRGRIQRYYFEDLFLMLANSDRRQITATEVAERKEEKLLALGPFLERLNQDLLDPLIDNSFLIMNERGLLPPAPEQLEGEELKVEYISVMAQAQKLAGLSSIETFTQFVGGMGQFDPEAIQKINTGSMVDHVADILGVPTRLIKSEDEMNDIKEAEQAAQEQAVQAQAIESQAKVAKDLSNTEVTEGNALDAVLNGEVPA